MACGAAYRYAPSGRAPVGFRRLTCPPAIDWWANTTVWLLFDVTKRPPVVDAGAGLLDYQAHHTVAGAPPG